MKEQEEKKVKAIDSLKRHLASMPQGQEETAWVAQMRELFKMYLGSTHELYVKTENFVLSRAVTMPRKPDGFEIRTPPSVTTQYRYDTEARGFIEQAISHIKEHGVYQPAAGESKLTFWSRIRHLGYDTLATILITAFLAGYSIGHWHGNNKFERTAAANEAALKTCMRDLDLNLQKINFLSHHVDSLAQLTDSLINTYNHQNKFDKQKGK
jgi:hypothetical protein